MQLFLVFVLCIYSSHSWVLKISPTKITPGRTKNVSLVCQYDNQNNGRPRMVKVSRILIHKFHGSDSWRTFAKILNFQSPVFSDEKSLGVSVKGHVETVENSFLSVMWSKAATNISGRYTCEVNGYADDDELVKVLTDPVSVTEAPLSLEYVLSLVQDVKGMVQTIHDELDNLKNDVNVTQERIKTVITREELDSILDSREEEGREDSLYWPGGHYALLETDTGCPSPPEIVWTSGYMTLQTEKDGTSMNSISRPNHLRRPIFHETRTATTANIRTCKHSTDASSSIWPKGTYCILRVLGLCPERFQEARIYLTPERDTGFAEVYNAPDGDGRESFYCCREDGDPNIPIHLPVLKPFYLYRLNGTCQTVHSARVSEEWLQIHTESSYNRNYNADSISTLISPDVTLNPARFSLCYYRKI